MLQVKVNATSANVCVGFDVLGLALSLDNTFTFELKDDFSFKGFLAKYACKENNLVYASYIKVFEQLNLKPIPVEIGFTGDIPVSRGLGSSSSLIVAGVFAANYFIGNKLSKEQLLDICCQIEGHPDNVAPAILGGLVASYKTNNGYQSISYPVSNKLKFFAVIPPFELPTHKARAVLPKALEYKDIINNLSRIIHLPKAFKEGDIKLLKDLFNDKLHEPYRGSLIKGYSEIKELLADEAAAFAISGSGSTMLIIAYDDSVINKISHLGYEIKSLSVGDGVSLKEV